MQVDLYTRKCTRSLYCPQCTGGQLCAQRINPLVPQPFSLPDVKGFLDNWQFGPLWDCSSDLWASDLDFSKTDESQVWDLDINSSNLGKPRKRITTESGRGSSVICLQQEEKVKATSFPKVQHVQWLERTWGQGLTFCWTEPFVLHPTRWHRLIKWTTWLSRQAEDLVMIPWGGSRGFCNYARSLKLQDSYLDILCCEQQFGGAVIFLLLSY